MRPRGSLRGPWPWSSLTACLPARFQLPHLQPWVSITPQGRTFRGGGKGWLRVDPFSGLATLSPMELGQGPGGLAFTLLMVTGFWGRGLGGPGGPASLEEGKTSLPGHPARLEVGQEGWRGAVPGGHPWELTPPPQERKRGGCKNLERRGRGCLPESPTPTRASGEARLGAYYRLRPESSYNTQHLCGKGV